MGKGVDRLNMSRHLRPDGVATPPKHAPRAQNSQPPSSQIPLSEAQNSQPSLSRIPVSEGSGGCSPTGRGSNDEFSVTLVKLGSVREVGVYLSLVDEIGLLVHNVQAGLVREWNRNHPELLIRSGDCIVSVNGARGDPAELIKMLKQNNVLHLKVRSSITYHVRIKQQEPSRQLGLGLSHLPDDKTLTVDEVSGGLISMWNEKHKDKEVKSGDRVIKVNEVCNNASKMLAVIMSEKSLDFLFFRLHIDESQVYRAASRFDITVGQHA